ncbi:hypothetical protein EI94DRAFT_747752 [Lactarius quietus]|nr:hypothetical protein EI94DRAFT_747752 [Lactarius quietus]
MSSSSTHPEYTHRRYIERPAIPTTSALNSLISCVCSTSITLTYPCHPLSSRNNKISFQSMLAQRQQHHRSQIVSSFSPYDGTTSHIATLLHTSVRMQSKRGRPIPHNVQAIRVPPIRPIYVPLDKTSGALLRTALASHKQDRNRDVIQCAPTLHLLPPLFFRQDVSLTELREDCPGRCGAPRASPLV